MSGFTVGDTFKKLKSNKIALIDADKVKYIVTYKIFKYLQSGEIEIFEKDDVVIKYTKEFISDFFERIDDDCIFCFSGKSFTTFRNHIAFEKRYKGNREGKVDKYDYPDKLNDMSKSVEYIMNNYNSLLFNDLEADDVICMLQDKNTYIISDDKDLKQIPGHHFDYGTNSLYEITNEQAVYNLASQLIKGDSTDNIPGIEGYGDVKTANYLMEFKKHSHLIPAALHLYQKKYGIFKGTDKFVESWNLIKLRENRGAYFLSQHQRMFDLKKMLLIKNNIDLK